LHFPQEVIDGGLEHFYRQTSAIASSLFSSSIYGGLKEFTQ